MSRLPESSRTSARAKKRRGNTFAAKTWIKTLRSQQGGTVALVLAATAILSTGLFLVQVFQTSAQGLEIAQMGDRTEELQGENERLAGKASELRSLGRIEKVAGELGMVRGGAPVYLSSHETDVAYNR